MSFIARLFKKHRSDGLAKRVQSISQKSPQECLDIVMKSSEVPSRVAAIRRLADRDTLLKLASHDESQQIETAARKRLGVLLDSGELTLDELTQSVQDEEQLFHICGYSLSAGSQLIERITNENLLVQLACNAGTTQLRQMAANRIETQVMLESLLKTARNKDKAVYRIAQKKMEAYKDVIARQAERTREVKSLCHRLEQLAKRNVDDIFLARKSGIEEAWSEYSRFAEEEESVRYARALSLCERKAQEFNAQKQAEAEQRQHENQARAGLLQNLQQLKAFLQALVGPDIDPEIARAQLEEIHSAFIQSRDETAARGIGIEKEAADGRATFDAASAILNEYRAHGAFTALVAGVREAEPPAGQGQYEALQRVLAHAQTLGQDPCLESIAEAQQALNNWRLRLETRQDQERQTIHEAYELLRRGNWAVSRGFVSRSNAILREIETKITDLKSVPAGISTKTESLREEVAKLGDWRDFAVTPKKETLIRQMEELGGSALKPVDLANRIQALQQEWKDLSRGGQHQDEALWQQFQTASDKAYEPCRAYFARQATERDNNAEKRQQLIEQLNTYLADYDWDNANWNDVEKTLKMAREAWQSYWPVPRRQTKTLQQTFDGIMDQLYDRLNAEYDKNRGLKQDLVDRAESLLAFEDTASAIEEAKRLQSQWRSIGRCKRRDDQQLWKQFRGHCDTVFERRHQETESNRQEQDGALREAEAIIDQLENFLFLSGDAFNIAKSGIDDLTAEFQAIGELPKAHRKAITEKFYQVIENVQAKIAQEKSDSKLHQWRNALMAAEAVRHYELAICQGEDAKFLQQQARLQLDSNERLPCQVGDSLQQRYEQAEHVDPADAGQRLTALRELCIRSEIATGNSSPPEDSGLRMQYQVGQLQQGLGQRESATETVMADIINRWIAVPAVPDEHYQALLLRLDRCWNLKIAASTAKPETC